MSSVVVEGGYQRLVVVVGNNGGGQTPRLGEPHLTPGLVLTPGRKQAAP